MLEYCLLVMQLVRKTLHGLTLECTVYIVVHAMKTLIEQVALDQT